MKKAIFLFALLSPFLMTGYAQDIDDMCEERAAKEEATELLEEYSYASSKTSSFYFINNEQVREIELNLFEGETYRLVFSNKYLPKNVEVRVYDKPKESKFRKMLFSSKTTPSNEMFIYEPSWKHRNLYIDYIVPPLEQEGEVRKGCAVFVVGYQLTFTEK